MAEREGDAIERRQKQYEQANMDDEAIFLDELRRQEESEKALVESEEAKQAIVEFYAQQRREYFEQQADQERERENQKKEQEAQQAQKAQESLDQFEEKLYQERMLKESDARTRELMENELYFEQMLNQADEFGLDRTALEEERRMRQDEINEKYNEKERQEVEALEKAKTAARTKAASEFAGLIGEMGNLAEEGSDAAKGLAIVEVLTNQAIAMAQTVANAQKAAKDGGPAAPFLAIAYTAAGIANVLSTFAGIKKILDQAKGAGSTGGVGSGGGGGGSRGQAPLIPNQNFDVENNAGQNVNVSAYVVQSQLQGSQLEYNQTLNRSTL